MKHLNANQKVLIFLIILVFIVSNLVTLIIVFPGINEKGIIKLPKNSDLSLIAYNSSGSIVSEGKIKYDESKLITEGSLLLKEKGMFEIYALSPLEFNYSKELLELRVSQGIGYLKTLESMTLIMGNLKLSLPKNFVGIYNGNSQSLIIIEGELEIGSESYSQNYLVYNFRDKFETEKIDRTIFSEDQNLSSLLEFVKSKTVVSKNLEDLVPPNLIVTFPNNEEKLASEQIQIKGKTEKNAILKINGIEVEVNSDGSFEYKVKLQEGLNNFSLESADEFENKNFLDVSYSFEKEDDTEEVSKEMDNEILLEN